MIFFMVKKPHFYPLFNALSAITLFICLLPLFAYSQQTTNKDTYIQKKLNIIDSLIQINQYDQALTVIRNVENTFTFGNDDSYKYELDFRYVQLLYDSGKEEKALEVSLKNVEKIDSQKDYDIYLNYINFLSKIFAESQNYDKAIQYNKQALDIAKKSQDTLNELKCLVRLGSFYYKMDKLDSAKIYYRRSTYFPVNEETEQRISNAYNNLGVIAQVEDRFDLAKGYSREALSIKEKVKDTMGIALLTANLGILYHFEKNYIEAIKNYNSALSNLTRDNSSKTQIMKQTINENISIAYDSLGDYRKAYDYLKISHDLIEDISKSSLSETLAEVEAKYNVERQEHQTEIQKNKTLRVQILFYGLSFLTIISIILGIIFYKNYKLKQLNRIEQIQNESQSRVINATIDAKEKERRKIAEILHDSVSALLSSANLHLQASKPHLNGSIPVEIIKAQGIIDEASVKIRDLSHQLISSVLLKFGLAFAVHDLCQKYTNSQLEFISSDKGIQRYSQKFEIKIYSIIEELVNNIIKHSKATSASIILSERNNNQLIVQIIDDGDGFDLKKAKEKNGLGLSHIEARIKYMKGVFNINTKKGEGTSIYISVPTNVPQEKTIDLDTFS